MKTTSIFKLFLFSLLLLVGAVGCVHDDDYSNPPVECTDFTGTISIADLKAMYSGSTMEITSTDDSDIILEGYVSSSDETGNIYKTLYIQDALENPTQGLTISVNETDMYTKFPVGAKIFIKLNGLYLGEYGGVIQLGGLDIDENGDYSFGRVSSLDYDNKFYRACGDIGEIVPLQLGINQFNDDLIGALVQINDVQFVAGVLCSSYAYDGVSANKNIEDCNNNTVLVRNSGYSSFYSAILPSGKGSMTAILSKYNSDYQLYLRDTDDTANMTGVRCGETEAFDCTAPDDNADIQDIKDLFTGSTTQITSDLYVTATVTANDASGNFNKLVYIEDATGGIQLRLNKSSLYLDSKYKVGSVITIAAKDLYVDTYYGEYQLGDDNGTSFRIPEDEIYKYVFANNETETVTPTTIGITDVSADKVGMLVTFDGVEFADSELGSAYAPSSTTNHTFQDCDGNTLIIRTSSYANFATTALSGGHGSLTGILSVYNGTYQLWLRDINDVALDTATRCDGTVAPEAIFKDTFESLANWSTVSVTGTQVWSVSSYSGNYFAKMSGYASGNNANEDWLISNAIAIPSTATAATLSFDTAKNYTGNDLEAYYTTNYTGDVTTTTWTQLSPALSTGSFTFVNSGDLDVSSAIGENLYVAFKYTSTTSASSTWEVDNVKVYITE